MGIYVIQKLEIGADAAPIATTLRDQSLLNGAETAGGSGQVLYFMRVDPHYAGAGRIDRGEVPSHDKNTRFPGVSHDRAVTLHPHNSVHDGKMRPEGRVQIADRFDYARHMKNILGPAVTNAG